MPTQSLELSFLLQNVKIRVCLYIKKLLANLTKLKKIEATCSINYFDLTSYFMKGNVTLLYKY